jgi:hypothetical protein
MPLSNWPARRNAKLTKPQAEEVILYYWGPGSSESRRRQTQQEARAVANRVAGRPSRMRCSRDASELRQAALRTID